MEYYVIIAENTSRTHVQAEKKIQNMEC